MVHNKQLDPHRNKTHQKQQSALWNKQMSVVTIQNLDRLKTYTAANGSATTKQQKQTQ